VKTKLMVIVGTMMVLASPMFAQGGAAAAGGSDKMWLYIAAGFSMAIASAFCGLAQGKAVASACEGMARNPGAASAIQTALLIGLAFIESLALYTLVIVFVKIS